MSDVTDEGIRAKMRKQIAALVEAGDANGALTLTHAYVAFKVEGRIEAANAMLGGIDVSPTITTANPS